MFEDSKSIKSFEMLKIVNFKHCRCAEKKQSNILKLSKLFRNVS